MFSTKDIIAITSLLLVIGCYYARRRSASARRRCRYARRPILGVDLDQCLPYFPPPSPAELASLDTRPFHSPCPPPSPVMRRQFPAPGSPNQQLLFPRQRQSAQRRLPCQCPLSPSLPATSVLPFLDAPPRSPALDLAHYQNRLNSTARADSPVRVEPAACLPSPLTVDSDSLRLLLGPPRSSLTTAHLDWPVPGSEMSKFPTCIELVVPAQMSSVSPAPTAPQLQIIPFDQPSLPAPFPTLVVLCPKSPTLATSPSPIQPDPPATFLLLSPQSQRPLIRRSPSVPLLSEVPLVAVLEDPRPCVVAPSEKKKSKKMKKRHSMDIRTSASPPDFPAIPALASDWKPPTPSPATTPSREASPEFISKGSASAKDGNVVATEEVQSCRVPLSEVYNTADITLTKHNNVEALQSLGASASRIHLAALISPSKAPRRVDRGPNPVYHYHSKAPAVAVARSVVRPVQDEFKSFSAGMGVKFGLRGWAEARPNELAPKKNKKKKEVVTKGFPIASPSMNPYPSPATGAFRAPSTMLLPAFEQQNCIRPVEQLLPTLTRDEVSSCSNIDLTSSGIARGLSIVESRSSEGVFNAGCHPECGDIYCPGGCSGIKYE